MTSQLAIALNQASANENEADRMLASVELSRGSVIVDWPKTFEARATENPARDGWHGMVMLDGTLLEWDGTRWH